MREPPAKDLQDAAAAQPGFEVVLYPNPPLSSSGFVAVIALLGLVVGSLGTAFALLGAWPVSGLLGLDVVFLWWAFRSVRRRALRHETIRLDANGLMVSRTAADGNSAFWRFEPTWVQIHIDEPLRRDSLITLSSHGRSLRLGAYITPDERVEVVGELRRALQAWRDPQTASASP